MIDLTKEERDYVLDLSRTYKKLHSEIGEIEKMMKRSYTDIKTIDKYIEKKQDVAYRKIIKEKRE